MLIFFWPCSEESPATAALKAQFRAHLSDKLIPELAANGSLGEDVSIVKLSVESVGGHGEDHWMSHAFRVAVEVRDKSGPRYSTAYCSTEIH